MVSSSRERGHAVWQGGRVSDVRSVVQTVLVGCQYRQRKVGKGIGGRGSEGTGLSSYRQGRTVACWAKEGWGGSGGRACGSSVGIRATLLSLQTSASVGLPMHRGGPPEGGG